MRGFNWLYLRSHGLYGRFTKVKQGDILAFLRTAGMCHIIYFMKPIRSHNNDNNKRSVSSRETFHMDRDDVIVNIQVSVLTKGFNLGVPLWRDLPTLYAIVHLL